MEKAIKILVIDDNVEFVKGIELLLGKKNCEIFSAYDGLQGYEKALSVKPDLILLDVVMPVMDGHEVLKQLKANSLFSNTIILLLSGFKTSTDDQAAGLEIGADGYISRPVSNRELLARITVFIRLIESERERKEYALKLEQYNEELQTSNKAKDLLFSIIAHDLRGPFNAFLGLLNTLEEEYDKLEETDRIRIIETIRKSSYHLTILLDNLLDWSLLQQKKITLNPVKVNLQEILVSCLEAHRLQIQLKEIKLNYSIPEKFEFYADQDMLQSIIRNLISNAVKFTPQHGRIKIFASRDKENSIVISVGDNGIGMSPETIRNLFTDGLDRNHDNIFGEKGSGLGLVLCRDFVEKHGGEIWVDSEEGKGSEFFFTLPGKYTQTSILQ